MATMHAFQKAARGPGMVFGTLAGERHALGSLLAAFIAAGGGIRALYLGPELPAAELAQAALRSRAAAVALSLVTPLADAQAQLAELCRRLDAKVEVWLGGAAAPALAAGVLPSNCTFFETYEAFAERVEVLRHVRSQ
jgi:cobalamin-dependent methionine synthase I